MLTLKNKADIEKLTGKTIMYRTVTYRITGLVEVNGQYIFSTDVKPLRFQEADLPAFLNELLPVETTGKTAHTPSLRLPATDTTILTELADSLMVSLRQMDTLTDDAEIKRAAKKAKQKVAISKAVTDIAKTHLLAARYAGK